MLFNWQHSCLLCCHGFERLCVFLSSQDHVSSTSLACKHLHDWGSPWEDRMGVSPGWPVRIHLAVWSLAWEVVHQPGRHLGKAGRRGGFCRSACAGLGRCLHRDSREGPLQGTEPGGRSREAAGHAETRASGPPSLNGDKQGQAGGLRETNAICDPEIRGLASTKGLSPAGSLG